MMSKKLDRLQNNNPLQRPGGQIDNRQLNKMFDGIIPQIEGSALGQTLQISRYENGEIDMIRFGKAEMSPVALTFTAQYDFNDWCDVVQLLVNVQDSINWWLGDLLRLCPDNWLEDAKRFWSQRTGLQWDTLTRYKSLCDNYTPEQRHPALSYSHHKEVRYQEDHELRAAQLHHAAVNQLSVRQFRAWLDEGKEEDESPWKQGYIDLQFQERRKDMNKIARTADAAIKGDVEKIRKVKSWVRDMREWLDFVESKMDAKLP